jgi:putative DNA primase/helicase
VPAIVGVDPAQRFTRKSPCPICGGHKDIPQGRGQRCYGFLSEDNKYAHCSREECAGPIPKRINSGTFAHKLQGDCHCGTPHDVHVAPVTNIEDRKKGSKNRTEVQVYDYTNLEGKLLHQTVRFAPKGFRQRRPNGNGGWEWSLKGVDTVLYRLPEVAKAIKDGRPIFVFEGEKDADKAREELGVTSTTNPMGAGKWQESYTHTLRGAEVVLVPDNDEAGRKHAEQVAAQLAPVAASVKLVELPGVGPGGDLCDWRAAGGSKEELLKLVSAAEAKSDPVDDFLSKRLSDYEPEHVRFLWAGRIPYGKITIIDGDPGDGKSVLTVYIAACVTQGRDFPDDAPCEAGGVVMISGEDGLADTIRPRIDAAGGDAAKVLPLAFLPDEQGGERPFSILDDLPILERAIKRVGASLVVIDPLMAFLPEKVSAHKDQDIRRALSPLAALAERTGVAVVVVRHLNKAVGSNPLYRGGGSIGIVGAARSALLVARDPEDEDVRVFAPLKQNLSTPASSLKYTIETAPNGAARVEWKGTTPFAAKDLLKPQVGDEEERSALAEAKQFLQDELSDGPMHSVQVLKNGRQAGVSEPTLRRAKTALKVRSEKEGDGSWSWSLPDSGGGKTTRGDHTPKDDHLGKVVKGDHLDHLRKIALENSLNSPKLSKDNQGDQGDQTNHVGVAGASSVTPADHLDLEEDVEVELF